MKTIALIVAGGSGTRFGASQPKQFLLLSGKPLLMRTINVFEQALKGYENEIVVVLPLAQQQLWRDLCDRFQFEVPHRVVTGGVSRWQSVKNGINAIANAKDADLIAVHDGVRPLVTPQLIRQTLAAATEWGSAVPVVPINDSMRCIEGDTSTIVDRSTLRAVQTPQVFKASDLVAAYQNPYNPSFTDDASVWESDGQRVHLVEGEITNLKITRPIDLQLAEIILRDA